jgi:hypothetical protein
MRELRRLLQVGSEQSANVAYQGEGEVQDQM